MSILITGFHKSWIRTTISSDILFPTERHERMVNHIPHADYHVIDSIYGHDGFLVESDQLNDIIMNFYQKTKNQSNE